MLAREDGKMEDKERPAAEEGREGNETDEAFEESESVELAEEELEKVSGGVRVAVFKKPPH